MVGDDESMMGEVNIEHPTLDIDHRVTDEGSNVGYRTLNIEGGGRRYDLRERLISYAVLVCRVAEKLPNTRVGKHVAGQLLRCGTAPMPHHAEAQGGESRKDFIHKMKLGLKELRESLVWLEFTRELDIGDSTVVEDAITETDQLVRIFVSSIATAQRNDRRTS
jgi:four helix bundle protein